MPRGLPTILIILLTVAGISWFTWWATRTFAPEAAPAQTILPVRTDFSTLHVMTANIRLDDPADGENGWAHRRHLVIRTFLKYQPDILACQEVSPAQGAFVNKELSQWYAYYPRAGVGPAAASNKDRGAAAQLLGAINESLASLNTIYYRKDRFDILDGEAGLVIPEEPQANATENTYYSLAVLKQHAPADRGQSAPSGEEVVVVIDVHLRHNTAFATQCAARVREKLETWMAKYPGSGGLVMGDMNHARGTAIYTALTEAPGKPSPALIDLFDYTKPADLVGTYHAFKGVPQASLPSDLILAAGTLQGTKPAEIIKDHEEKVWPSDHYFVRGELRFVGNRE